MTITGAIVLLAVTWFIVLFIVLPIGERSQSEAGEVVPGTPASAPEDAMMKKKLIWTTIISLIVWGILLTVILSGLLKIEYFDVFNRMNPEK